MRLLLTPQFLNDLREAADHRFVSRVIAQVIDAAGQFRRDKDDHRYHGIEDAWIRYVTKSYRLIYIRRDDRVYLYRTGPHSIEDNLPPPSNLQAAVPIEELPIAVSRYNQAAVDVGELLKTSQATKLSKVVQALQFVGHREVYLVSPFVSPRVLDRYAPFGRFLDRAIEESAAVVLITRCPKTPTFDFYAGLEARGIMLHFHPTLHAKLYVFEIDRATLSQFNKDMRDTAILGSANLTEMGLALQGHGGNEELCYRLPNTMFDEAKQYAQWLMHQSTDFITYRQKYSRRY